MLSSNENIETIGQLVEVAKHYIGLQANYLKLDFTAKLVKVTGFLALAFIFAVLSLFSFVFFSIAGAKALTPIVGAPWAFCIVGGIFILLMIVILVLRKPLIEKPVIKLLSKLILEQ